MIGKMERMQGGRRRVKQKRHVTHGTNFETPSPPKIKIKTRRHTEPAFYHSNEKDPSADRHPQISQLAKAKAKKYTHQHINFGKLPCNELQCLHRARIAHAQCREARGAPRGHEERGLDAEGVEEEADVKLEEQHQGEVEAAAAGWWSVRVSTAHEENQGHDGQPNVVRKK